MSHVLFLALLTAAADEVGSPTALAVHPESVTLAGPRSAQQVVVTGRYADGTERDLTPFAEWQAEAPDVVEVLHEPLDVAAWRALDTHEKALGRAQGRPRVKVVDLAEMRTVARAGA